MKIVAKLNKPYTEEQRADFIVENNHNNNCLIEETDTAIEAYTYDESEIAEQQKQARINQIYKELNNIDLKSIRAIRANDTEYIEKYEKEIIDLRNELNELKGE